MYHKQAFQKYLSRHRSWKMKILHVKLKAQLIQYLKASLAWKSKCENSEVLESWMNRFSFAFLNLMTWCFPLHFFSLGSWYLSIFLSTESPTVRVAMEEKDMDYVLVPLGLGIMILYHIWLVYTVLTNPRRTVIGLNAESRHQWVFSMMAVSLLFPLLLTDRR